MDKMWPWIVVIAGFCGVNTPVMASSIWREVGYAQEDRVLGLREGSVCPEASVGWGAVDELSFKLGSRKEGIPSQVWTLCMDSIP